MNIKKLKLQELTVKSIVTNDQNRLKGGRTWHCTNTNGGYNQNGSGYC